MGFFEAIQTCFTKYVVFEGRARRAEYWWFFLFNLIVSAVGRLSPLLSAIVSLALILPNLAVNMRRLHDVDRSGWYLLLPLPAGVIALVFYLIAYTAPAPAFAATVMILGGLATLACYLVLLVWYCQRGTVGANRFGPDPLTLARVAP
ncbi:MAG: DUF805 domain-containing protein [Candidatus Binataceae bacterium]